jgi:hypothetical protein
MAIEDIGELINTKIPGYADDADIQAALRIYHYGTDDPTVEAETNIAEIPADSVARRLHDLRQDLTTLDTELDGKIGASAFNAKGDLLVGTANDTYQVLTSGSNGKTLVVNVGTSTGLEWQDFPTSFTNLSAATLNVSGNAVFHISIVNKTGSYTPTVGDISDDGKLLQFSSSSAHTFTIPTNANNPYPLGTQISVLQTGIGQTSIIGASGVSINCTPQPTANTAKLRTQWSSATLIKRDTNAWVVIGDISAVS